MSDLFSNPPWLDRALKTLEQSLSAVPQELNELDWKESLSPDNNKLSKHLSAFGNHPGGGFIVFGINDDTAELIGVDNAQVKSIIETLSNLARNNVSPQVRLDHTTHTFKGKNLLFIYVEESPQKPVHLNNKSVEDSYIRSGGTTRIVGKGDLSTLFLNSRVYRFETLQATSLISWSEVEDKLNFRAICKLLKTPMPTDKDELVRWAISEKLVESAGNNAGFYITNLGALSAAYDLEEFDDLARKVVRVITYEGNNRIKAKKETVFKQGYALDYESVINHLVAILPSNEIIKHALREEVTLYPEIALRELVANALIHQDFQIGGKGPMIEIFSDRIEISNPGRLLASKHLKRLIGTSPESRNEKLAGNFRRYNICEERGSGFAKTVHSVELWGLPPLKFEEGTNDFKVTIFAPKSFADMSAEERLDACEQHTVLRFYVHNDGMTNTTLRERFQMSERQRPQISKLIKEALDMNIIKPKDPLNKSSKFAVYVPAWA